MQQRAKRFLLAAVVCTSTLSLAQLNSYRNGMTPDLPSDGNARPSLTGLVTRMDGSPLHDIRIELRSVSTGAVLATSYSNLTGSFDMTGLRSGDYEVVAIDGVTETREHVLIQTGPTNVTLRMNSRSAFSPSRGTISVSDLRTPEKARHLVEKAREALAKNHFDDARKNVSEALVIAPDFAEALTLQAVVKLNDSQPQAAIDDLDHAIKSNPSYGPAYLVAGAAFNQMSRFDEALRSLDRSSQYDPNSWQCAFESAKAWLGKGDFDHAIQQLNRVQTLTAGRAMSSIHILRGYAFMGQKHLEQASAELEAYLTAEPNGPSAGTVRLLVARLKTEMAQKTNAFTLTPAVAGLFESKP